MSPVLDLDRMSLRHLLANVANELRLVAHAGREIEDSVGDEIRSGLSDIDRLRHSLQGLDHLVQTVSELSTFLEDIGLQTDGEQMIDVKGAAQRVRLRELGLALAGSARPKTTSALGQLGDVDLF